MDCAYTSVQHDGLSGSGPAPSVGIVGSFEGNENTTVLILRLLYTVENVLTVSALFYK